MQLMKRHEDEFSKHKLDCGKANEFVHQINLSDDGSVRLTCCRVPPAQYQKLRSTLSEMNRKLYSSLLVSGLHHIEEE